MNIVIRMRSTRLFIIVLLGLTPLLWWRPGYIIAKGDSFPIWFRPDLTFHDDTYLWSTDYLGNPSILPAYIFYDLVWLFLSSLQLTTDLIQILLHVLSFMCSGLSMYYLSKTIYPRLRWGHVLSAVFYMFNIFVILIQLNLGFMFTYAFLPLLMGLLIRVIQIADSRNVKLAHKYTVYLSIVLAIELSLVSVNPANIALTLLVLSATACYFLVKASRVRTVLASLGKTFLLCLVLNIWWMIPILNYYVLAGNSLNPSLNVSAWSWTHVRASLLNIFWLNGVWSWRPEYFPYYDSYSNPYLIIITFVPFLLAASALLFKTEFSQFNSYAMLIILIFIFLAKGTHQPLAEVNYMLYASLPFMSIFREAASKFTLAFMPFLALLVGYSADRILSKIMNKARRKNAVGIFGPLSLIIIFIISSYPLMTNPIETKTSQLPFSSYVKIPSYWFQAASWLNTQRGEFRVLVTPPNDFYQMPYNWGYYGQDGGILRLIQKPIISTDYLYSYSLNPNIVRVLQLLSDCIRYNKTEDFRNLLDLLAVKYILQRNDVLWNFDGRRIMSPSQMHAFFASQPYLRLVKTFGQLDIYEYTESKPYLYFVDFNHIGNLTDIIVVNATVFSKEWKFTENVALKEWQDANPTYQFGAELGLTQDRGTLRVELCNTTREYKIVSSPLVPAVYGASYYIELDIAGQNTQSVHLNIAEYDSGKNLLRVNHIVEVDYVAFNMTNIALKFQPTTSDTKYIQLQVWHGHEMSKPLPKIICINSIKVYGYTWKTVRLETQPSNVTILDYKRETPTKIVMRINTTAPFILVVREALNRQWTLYADGRSYKPETVNMVSAAFVIDHTGIVNLQLVYEPQIWYYVGLAISFSTWISCLAFIAYWEVKDSKNHIRARFIGRPAETKE